MSTSEDTKRLIGEAKHSVTALHRISTNPQLIRDHASQLLPLILQHIANPIPEPQCSQLSATRLSLPHYSLAILKELLLASGTSALSRSRPQACLFFQTHWLLISAWVTFFLETVALEGTHILDDVTVPTSPDHSLHEEVDLRNTIWRSTISLLSNATHYPQSTHHPQSTLYPQYEIDNLTFVSSTTHLVSVLIRSWIAAAENKHDTLLDTIILLAHVHPHAVEEGVWALQCSGSVLEDPSSKAACICLHRLTELLDLDQGMDSVVLAGFMHLLNACLDGSYKFHRSLLANGSISLMTHMMSRATSRVPSIPSTHELRLAQDFLGNCTRYLLRCFNDSPTWLSVALKGHFIISIFKSLAGWSPASSTGAQLESNYASVFEHIKPRLVYDSVLREVLRSIRTIKGRGLEDIIKGRGDLEEIWIELCQAAFSLKEVKTQFRSFGLGACALRSECRHGNAKSAPTKECSRCLSVVYCSIDCQKYSWEHGHREQCLTILSRRRGGYPEPVSPKDHDFFWAVFYSEYQKRTSEIKETRRMYMESSRRNLGIRHRFPNTFPGLLDFRSSPVGVSLDDSGYGSTADSGPIVSAMYEKAKSGPGELGAAIFPSGDPEFPEARSPITLFALIDPAMDFREALEQKFLERQPEFGAVRSVYF